MAAPIDLDDLTGQIYDAVLAPQRLPTLLDDIRRAFAGSSAVMITVDCVTQRSAVTAMTDTPAEAIAAYNAHFWALDPWRIGAARMGLGTGESAVADMLIDRREFTRSEMWNDFLRPLDRYDYCGGIVQGNAEQMTVIGIHRGRRRPPFAAVDMQRFLHLAPHLGRAIRIIGHITNLELSNALLTEGFDHSAHGVVFLGQHGVILSMNQVATQMLALHDGLRSQRCLLASRPADRSALADAIAQAAGSESIPQNRRRASQLSVARSSGRRPWLLTVIPLGVDSPVYVQAGAHCVVFMVDPEQRANAPERILATTYRLTHMERRLAQRLLMGDSLVDAAETLGITAGTARQYLKRVFRKTGTRRQVDLLPLMQRMALAPR